MSPTDASQLLPVDRALKLAESLTVGDVRQLERLVASRLEKDTKNLRGAKSPPDGGRDANRWKIERNQELRAKLTGALKGL